MFRKSIFLWVGSGLLAFGAVSVAALFIPRSATNLALTVPRNAEHVERGRYIFEHVSDCSGCHSVRDFSRFGGPVVKGGTGKGHEIPGTPFRVVAPNITPDRATGIGDWTDGEKIRAIREGIGRDGRVLFPMMPYSSFRNMSDYDVQSLVAYLDTLTPIYNPLPRTQVPDKLRFLMRMGQKSVRTVSSPERDESSEYGAYLVSIAGCGGCHTPKERGRGRSEMRFAGGAEFRFPPVMVVSANITPDPETGIGSWTKDYFLAKFRQHANYGPDGPPEVGPEQFTVMPWLAFGQLDVHDLTAIYNYLQTQAPVRQKVQTHPTLPTLLTARGKRF
jgi:hypothetical protein